LFKNLNQPIAQILLTKNDIQDRTQYLNAANTFSELLTMGVIPIVNENDTISVSEIRFGDNDTLSAITAGMVNADYLFLMTDVDCLYTDNPRTNPNAEAIEVVEDVAVLKANGILSSLGLTIVTSPGSSVGTGGMVTKLIAAELAASVGVTTIITRASLPGNIFAIVKHLDSLSSRPSTPQPEHTVSSAVVATPRSSPPPKGQVPLHTRFLPKRSFRDRQFWLLHGMAPRGRVIIDEGALKALTRVEKAGLLPVGVVDTEGTFSRDEAVTLTVAIRDADGNITGTTDVGRALVNYSATEIQRIKGKKSTEIVNILGYADGEYIAHRDNMVFMPKVTAALSKRE
jgi:glutamate 5-kinase